MPQSPPYLELYVRSMLPDGAGDRQETLLDRLDRLEREGDIAGYNVIVWGKQIAPESAAAATDEGRYILNRISEFQQWALANNVSLESFSQRRQVDSEASDEPSAAIVLPVMGLAEYHGSELAHVAPCTDKDEVRTITDRLDRLEAGEQPSAPQETADRTLV